MVRFGAKKEEFIPPFLFYHYLRQKKRGHKALSVFVIKYLFMHVSRTAHLQHPN